MMEFTGNLSTQISAEFMFENSKIGDEFIIRIAFRHPVPKRDHFQHWNIIIKGTAGKIRKSSFGVEQKSDGVATSMRVLVSGPKNGASQSRLCRISAALYCSSGGDTYCNLRLARDEQVDDKNYPNPWIYVTDYMWNERREDGLD
jgi:hypothetical protein